MLLPNPHQHNNKLLPQGRCKFCILRLHLCLALFIILVLQSRFNLTALSLLDSRKLTADFDSLRAVNPCLVPIDFRVRARCSTDSSQHPFRRILAFGALGSTVLLKIINENTRSLADLAKVDGLTTSSEEEETVKLFKKHSGRLVDGTENSLTVFGQLSKEEKNVPGGLRVETRGGFVEEKQKGRLGYELNTNGEPLSLFNIET